MAKVKQPLFSLDARRKLGDEIVYGHRQKANIVERRPIPKDARSVGQLSWRHMFLKVVALWHALSAAEKEAWESLARPRHMTGYAWFVSQALRPNPGIYLPLQGGTMTGNIDMGAGLITNLAAPSGATYATRRSYVIARIAADILTHKGDASAHHTKYTDAAALAAAIAGGLSKVVWKDASQQALADLNRVASLGWTDLDLTAYTSANSTFAIIQIAMVMDSITGAATSWCGVRKNGTTPTYTFQGRLGATRGDIAGAVYSGMKIVGLDSDEIIEYEIGITGTIRVDTYIRVMGYIE